MNLSKELLDFINNAENFNLSETEKAGRKIGEFISRSLADKDKWCRMLQILLEPRYHRAFVANYDLGFEAGLDKKPIVSLAGIKKSNKISDLEVNDILAERFRDFKVLEDEQGRRNQILELKEHNALVTVNKEKLAIIAAKTMTESTGELWSAERSERAVTNWTYHTEPFISKIAPASFKQDEKFAYYKADINPKYGSHPLFSEFLSRTTNSKALCAFIWSLFEPESNTHQYVWLYGDGGNGKSSLGDFLSRCLGNSYMSKNSINAYGNKHFSASLVGKRLAVFEDSNSTRFIQSGSFKEITGGGLVEVEAKFEHAYSTRLFVKFLFLSNFAPELSSKKADLRRIILCHVGPIKGEFDTQYNDRLWEERDAILHTCREAYSETLNKGFILTESSNASLNSKVGEVAFDDVFNNYLEVGGSIDTSELFGWVKAPLKSNGLTFNQFYDWLQRVKGVKIEESNIIGITRKEL